MTTPRNAGSHSTTKPHDPAGPEGRPGLRWTAVIFAFACNLLLFTVVSGAAGALARAEWLLWASMLGPIVAGVLTALVARQRGGIHAFIGGVATIPVIALFLIPGAWRTAIFAACFCTLGGALTEVFQRSRRTIG